MLGLPIDATNISGRHRVEDSLLGASLIPSKTILSAPSLFLGDEVGLLVVIRETCPDFPEVFIYFRKFDVTVADNRWVCNYSDFYILHRSIDWLGNPQKTKRRGAAAFRSEDHTAYCFQPRRPITRRGGEMEATLHDIDGPPIGSTFLERCEDIDFEEDQAAVQLDGEQMILWD